MYDSKIFSQRIKELRQKKNLTQKELAEQVGTTAATISAYENSDDKKRKSPTLENALAIAKVFDVSLDWIVGISETENKTTSISLPEYLSTILHTNDLFSQYDFCIGSRCIDYGKKVAVLEFSHESIVNLLDAWDQLLNLYNSGNMDKTLYEICLKGIIDKCCKDYEVVKKKRNEEFEEILSDEDLPF